MRAEINEIMNECQLAITRERGRRIPNGSLMKKGRDTLFLSLSYAIALLQYLRLITLDELVGKEFMGFVVVLFDDKKMVTNPNVWAVIDMALPKME